MSTKHPTRSPSESDTLRETLLRDNPALGAIWEETRPKREAAMMLARLRHFAGLTQKDIADRTDWDKGFVSRLESAEGSLPDPQTIVRYAEACGAVVGMIVGAPGEGSLHVIDSITLRPSRRPVSPHDMAVFERLRDQDISLDGAPRAVLPTP